MYCVSQRAPSRLRADQPGRRAECLAGCLKRAPIPPSPMLDVRRGPKGIPVASTENSITVADTAFNPTEFLRPLRAAETLIRFVTQSGVRCQGGTRDKDSTSARH